MTVSVVIAAVTVFAMAASVIFKPFIKIKKFNLGLYWVICLVGAAIMVCTGQISFSQISEGLFAPSAVNPLKILALFLSMTLISVYLGDSGFFAYVADKIFVKHSRGGLKLFLALYLVVSVLTVFTSNDIIILTFTPPVIMFCKKAGISPIPYLFGEFVAANSWSMALIVGNPTNIYLAGSFSVTFSEYFSVMWFAAILGGATSLLMLLVVFRKSLFCKNQINRAESRHLSMQGGFYGTSSNAPSCVKTNKFLMICDMIHLGLCIVFLAISDLIGVEMWLICVILFGSLTIFTSVYSLIKEKSLRRTGRVLCAAPYELIPFIISMFIIVLALARNGFTEMLFTALCTETKNDAFIFGFLSAGAANVFNNIPMSVLFEKIIAGKSAAAVYGTIIGSNLGAFITPVGALAGIMWNKLLAANDVKFSFRQFILYGTIIALPSLAAACGALYLTI